MAIYVFDSNSLSAILNHYYPARFPTFWHIFNQLSTTNGIGYVREVQNELIERFDK
ncbi:MAG: DUF4411 family protein, partial [Candidatus Kuenenia stuttgartiensis]|nr:DUF4411 family protein [Candidatus Kuenenia stuttgartiensis]